MRSDLGGIFKVGSQENYLPVWRNWYARLPAGRRAGLKMSYYFYAIKSLKDSSIYKGIAKDPDLRLEQHNLGKTESTKNKKPFMLVYVEKCNNRIEAREKEKYYKSGYGREQLKILVDSK